MSTRIRYYLGNGISNWCQNKKKILAENRTEKHLEPELAGSTDQQLVAMFALVRQTMTKLDGEGYIEYGAGDFDGQNSGHDFWGVSSSSAVMRRKREGLSGCWERAWAHAVPTQ